MLFKPLSLLLLLLWLFSFGFSISVRKVIFLLYPYRRVKKTKIMTSINIKTFYINFIAKLVIISANCPPLRKSELEYYAMLSKTGVHHYSGSMSFFSFFCYFYITFFPPYLLLVLYLKCGIFFLCFLWISLGFLSFFFNNNWIYFFLLK